MERDASQGNLSISPLTTMKGWTRNAIWKGWSFTHLVVTTRRWLDDELRPFTYTSYAIYATYPPLAVSVTSIITTSQCTVQSHQNTDKEDLFQSFFHLHPQCPSHYITLSKYAALYPSVSSYFLSFTKLIIWSWATLSFCSTTHCIISLWSTFSLADPYLGKESPLKPLNSIPILLQILHKDVSSVAFCKTQHPCTNEATGNLWLLIYTCSASITPPPKKKLPCHQAYQSHSKYVLSTCWILP